MGPEEDSSESPLPEDFWSSTKPRVTLYSQPLHKGITEIGFSPLTSKHHLRKSLKHSLTPYVPTKSKWSQRSPELLQGALSG